MGTIFGSKNFDLATQSAIFLVSKMITFGKSDSFRRSDLGSWPRVNTLYCPSLLPRSLLFFTFALKNSQSSWVENYCNQCSIASFSRSAWSRTPSYCLAGHNPSFSWETGKTGAITPSLFLSTTSVLIWDILLLSQCWWRDFEILLWAELLCTYIAAFFCPGARA